MASCRNKARAALSIWSWPALGAACFLLAAVPCLAQTGGDKPWQESYVNSGEVEQIYGAAADAIDLDQARQLLLELVNDERAKRKFSALAPLGKADQLALEHAGEMARKHYASHYSLAGLKCEARWNAMGETDQVAENMAYYEIDHHIYLTPQLVRRMHQHWMESESHRKNLLDPYHTALGCAISIGYANGRSYIGGVEEFIDDYGDCERLPAQMQPDNTLAVRGWLDPARAKLRFIGLGSEDLPFARSVEYQMSHITGYSPPDVALGYTPQQYKGRWSPPVKYHNYDASYDETTGEYTVSVEIAKHWPPGAYYFTAWASPPGNSDALFCAMAQVVVVKPL
jgi:uncharacterized protein YkwD